MTAPDVPDVMTAAVLTAHGGPEVLQVRDDVPVPRPGPGEVLVRVTAAALNNTDVWTRRGAYGRPGDPDALAGWRGPIAFPRIQGGDLAGHVASVGPEVDTARVGTRVLVDPALYDGDGPDATPVGLLGSEADGGFAQYAVVADERAHDVGDSTLTDAQLASLPVAAGTAMGMLERVGLVAGERVLVTGASGGVGLAAVGLAAARGAHVTAVTRTDKADPVAAAGADVVLDRGDPLPDGLDVVVDVVGGDGFGALVDALTEGGRLVVAGAVAGPVVPFDLRRLYLHQRVLVGSSMHTPAHFAALVDAARSGAVAPRVAATYPLADLAAAQEDFLAHDHVGKLVVLPG